jgi:hypothetical protein
LGGAAVGVDPLHGGEVWGTQLDANGHYKPMTCNSADFAAYGT